MANSNYLMHWLKSNAFAMNSQANSLCLAHLCSKCLNDDADHWATNKSKRWLDNGKLADKLFGAGFSQLA